VGVGNLLQQLMRMIQGLGQGGGTLSGALGGQQQQPNRMFGGGSSSFNEQTGTYGGGQVMGGNSQMHPGMMQIMQMLTRGRAR
jgi:hypothetical protein